MNRPGAVGRRRARTFSDAGASSDVFRTFFKLLFGTVAFGVLHGLLLTPVLLAAIYHAFPPKEAPLAALDAVAPAPLAAEDGVAEAPALSPRRWPSTDWAETARPPSPLVDPCERNRPPSR